jgi:ADP-ribose pyrophosphatase YjhB (NUDIX family)
MVQGIRGVLYRGEKFLLAQHARPLPDKVGKWGFLGGRIDATDSSPEAALRREVREEIRHELSTLVLIGDRTYNKTRYRIFASELAEDVTWWDEGEIATIKWFTLAQVRELEAQEQLHTGFEYSCISDWVTRRESMLQGAATLEPLQQAARRERLQATYGAAISLLLQEAKTSIDRTNIFLLFSSLLLTVFAILRQVDVEPKFDFLDPVLFWLPIVGILMCPFHVASIVRAKEAADFWRGSTRIIEEDADFWYPGKLKIDADLDIFLARHRYLTKEAPTRQMEQLFRNRSSPIPKFAKWLVQYLPSSDKTYMYWVPGFVATVWLVCFVSQAWRVLSAA